MDDGRRFSAAPLNFDRFVALNRSHSRSLSPDHELHQMLRPYHTRPSTTSNASAAHGSKKGNAPATSTHVSDAQAESATVHPLFGVDREPCSAVRRSSDLAGPPATATAIAAARARSSATLDSTPTQAATSTSRSVSGGAALSSTAASVQRQDVPQHVRVDPFGARQYVSVNDETQDLSRSQGYPEEVDLLLQAVRQLGSPMYNPVTRQLLCWNMHPLQERPRAAYGNIEGVSCDFCGHTDWLEDEVEMAEGSTAATSAKKKAKTEEVAEEDKLSHLSSLSADSLAHTPRVASLHRRLYHCPVCEVDLCLTCVAEVQQDARFHVPCMQCQQCGAYETRRSAPVHRCGEAASGGVRETKKAETKHDVKVEEDSYNAEQGGQGGGNGTATSKSPSSSSFLSMSSFEPNQLDRVPTTALPTPASQRSAGVPLGGSVRLGLSRSRGPGAIKPDFAHGTGVEAAKEVKVEGAVHEENSLRGVLPPSSSSLGADAAPAPAPLPQIFPAAPSTRKRMAPLPSPATAFPKQQRAERKQRGGEEEAAIRETQLTRELHGFALSKNGMRALSVRATSVEADRAIMASTVSPYARYEVHVTPRSMEEVEEVHRMAREHNLVCATTPSLAGTTTFYFPTRLAAERCVERATAGSLEALVKRHVPHS